MVRQLLDERLDMVTGTRLGGGAGAYRPGHRFGNLALTGMVRLVFGTGVTDMLSGYRVFSRRFVKSFPALASGFETETEFTVHALELHMPIGEVPTAYGERPEGSTSKLNTWRDGMRILRTIVALVKRERPLPFFGAIAAVLFLLGVGLFVPVLVEYAETGLVPRLPTAVLSHRNGAAVLPGTGLRADPGYRHARAAGGEADGLSRAARLAGEGVNAAPA